MLYRWIFKKTAPAQDVARLQNEYTIHPVIAQIFLDRNLETPEKIDAFLNPDLSSLHDPFLMQDMDKAINRIIDALREGEDILIYGDYDVDGITGVSILYDALFHLGGKVSFYIPNRMTDGYGLSPQGIDVAIRRRVKLIVTIDCGITAVDEVEYARENGVDVIVCDHHEPADKIPNAYAVLDPKLKECGYPFKELAGVGVGFKVIQALYQTLDYDPAELGKYLDLVAIGTAADIVPLMDENRILVRYGLERINSKPRNGIFALLESSSLLGREINVSLIVFVMAPRLNAVGRMSSAKKAVHLLTSTSLQQARNIARILETENRMRRNIDDITCQQAIELVESSCELDESRILVLAQEDWHPGVIGIVASRIMEKFNRPTILISIKDGVGKGSARSTLNFDMYAALNSVNHLLENFGGHKFAAGLTIRKENIAELREQLERISLEQIKSEAMIPSLDIESELAMRDIDAQFLKWLKRLSPYGPQNMRPVFVTRDVEIVGQISIVGNNHLKIKVKKDGIVIDAIAYNFGEAKYSMKPNKQRIDVAYVIEENTWNGQTTIQMRIKDINIL
jgi:single-stranded-DNA-specific exonuclease